MCLNAVRQFIEEAKNFCLNVETTDTRNYVEAHWFSDHETSPKIDLTVSCHEEENVVHVNLQYIDGATNDLTVGDIMQFNGSISLTQFQEMLPKLKEILSKAVEGEIKYAKQQVENFYFGTNHEPLEKVAKTLGRAIKQGRDVKEISALLKLASFRKKRSLSR